MRFPKCFQGLQKLSSLSCDILPVPQGLNSGPALCCGDLLAIHSTDDSTVHLWRGSHSYCWLRRATFVPRRRERGTVCVLSGNIPDSRDEALSMQGYLTSPISCSFALVQACSKSPLSSTLAAIFSKVTRARTDGDARVRTPHPCIQIYRVFRLISHSDTIY